MRPIFSPFADRGLSFKLAWHCEPRNIDTSAAAVVGRSGHFQSAIELN